jgi:hypothetical protein
MPSWPSVEEQFAKAKVISGNALDKLIRDNQDFHLLRPEEADDNIRLPPWLRVYWRKQHPEGVYSADDPTGGYPRVLKNIHTWMLANQNLQPSPPPGPGPTAAREALAPRAAVGTNQRISGGHANPRSESDIRVSYNDANKIIAASNAIGDSNQAQFYSSDGGASWSQTTLPLVAGDFLHSDPCVDWTSDGTAWAVTIGIDMRQANLQLRSYRSADGGATWTAAAAGTVSGNQTAADKEMMWVDHSPTSAHKDNIYVIWHNNQPAFVARRAGPGGLWQAPIQVSGAETTGTAIGGDVKTNSAGDVFAFWPDTGSRNLFVAKSTNGGATFSAPVTIATAFGSFQITVPSFATRNALIYVCGGAFRTATKDLVYAIWTDLTGEAGCTTGIGPGTDVTSTCKSRIWFSRSTNGGATWEASRMINNQKSLNDQFNPHFVADETNGQLVVMYYDTVADTARLKTDVWVQTSSDDGVTWSDAVKVTSAQTDETAGTADSGNQYGDYNGLSGYAGILFPSWTDRRSGGPEEIWTARISTAEPPGPMVQSLWG